MPVKKAVKAQDEELKVKKTVKTVKKASSEVKKVVPKKTKVEAKKAEVKVEKAEKPAKKAAPKKETKTETKTSKAPKKAKAEKAPAEVKETAPEVKEEKKKPTFTGKPSNMEELLAATGYTLSVPKPGTVLKGIVTDVTKKMVLVDIGAKTEGMVVDREFEAAQDYITDLKQGDEVSVFVVSPENDRGQILLSLKGYLMLVTAFLPFIPTGPTHFLIETLIPTSPHNHHTDNPDKPIPATVVD